MFREGKRLRSGEGWPETSDRRFQLENKGGLNRFERAFTAFWMF